MPGDNRAPVGGRLPLAAALLGLILLPFVAGCGRGTATPTAVTITFACPDEEITRYEGLAQAFAEGHPSIAVKLLPRRPIALQALRPGDSDVFVASTSLASRIERGEVLALDAWLAAGQGAARADYYPAALVPFTHDGKTWAAPVGLDPVLMFYNKDLFDQRQVPYPREGWNWDDLLLTARRLRDPARGVYGYAAGTSHEEALLFVLQHGGRLVDDMQRPTRLTFDDPLVAEAMQWYADLMFRHDVAPNPEEARAAFGGGRLALANGIAAGKIGMWAGSYSSWWVQGRGKAKFAWGAAALPRDREEATFADVEALAISAQAEHPVECWQWVSYLSTQVPAGLVPARRSVAASEQFAQLAGADVAAAAQAALEHVVLLPQEPADLCRRMTDLWATAVDDITSGRYSPQGAMAKAQRAAGK